MTDRYDLHIHSLCSDGSNSPIEIINMCKEAKLTGFSITDHDTYSAYSKEVLKAAKEANLKCITGMELSTLFENQSIHLLVYNFSIDCPVIKKICERQRKKRKERNAKILSNLSNRFNFDIAMEDIYLKERDTVGRLHIAEKMVEMGYVSSLQQAFNDYIGDGKRGHAQVEFISLKDAVILLKASGAFVSLAHPHIIDASVYKKIWKSGIKFDAVECFWKHAPMWQCKRFLDMVNEKKLQCTGGSDFHGKSYDIIGSSYVEKLPEGI